MRWTFSRLAGDRPHALGERQGVAHAPHVRIALLCLAACGAGAHPVPRATTGAIAGLARDHDSGDPIAKAEVRIRATGELSPHVTTSNERGLYDVERLAPGRYSLSASFAGQPVDVENIDVRAGETTVVDLVFTLGRPDPVKVDFGDPKEGAIDRYKPHHLTADAAIIEGTVNDAGTRLRVAGAVITAVDAADRTQQTVSDTAGRYHFELAPGTYSISAYYSIGGRGQIEVRRSGIDVHPAEAVVVPLWVELAR
jgi:carboxypeptidase family protein